MEEYSRELRQILGKHAPKKVKNIASLLRKFRGREQDLIRNVRRKYTNVPKKDNVYEPANSFENVRVVVRVRPKIHQEMTDNSDASKSCVEVLGDLALQRVLCRIVVASSSIAKTPKDADATELLSFFRTYPGLQRQIGGLIASFVADESGTAIRLRTPSRSKSNRAQKILKFGSGTVFDGTYSQKVFYDQSASYIVDSVLQGK